MVRDRRVANYLFLLYFCASLVILSLPFSDSILALRACVTYLWSPAPLLTAYTTQQVSSIPPGVAHLLVADSENRELKERLKKFSMIESQNEALRKENDRFRKLLGIKPDHGKILRWARIMERDPANWYRHIVIDEGKEDGLVINAPVLGEEEGRLGVVGRITELGPHWSKILLISDELSSVASYVPSKQWEGLIEGQGKELLMMNYLPVDSQLTIGDLVYTSPTSPTFPADILVGNVSQIFPQDPFLTFRSVGVSPAIHASKLKEVMILLPNPNLAQKPL